MEITITTAAAADLPFLLDVEQHIAAGRLEQKVQAGEILIARAGSESVGYLRYGFFWDAVPFMNMLWVLEPYRRQGVGRKLVARWEAEMEDTGHSMVMTSTLANEEAQHFYRRLGYRDTGGFVLPGEALELIFMKPLPAAAG